MAKHLILWCVLCLPALYTLAQSDADPVLFSVEGNPVHVSEFTYIYSKTNGDKADFSRESLEEYLDLYIRFKLKVQKARDMQLDTIPSLNKELAGYRRQLADSYLIDKEVTEKLIREVYERTKQDVDLSHILVALSPGASDEETEAALEKARQIRKRLLAGEDFAQVATEMSDDKSAQKNGGHIGYVTAMFPRGLYELENAAYTLPEGKYSEPIRTAMGFHILQVHDRRPARGEVEAAHILIRTNANNTEEAKQLIDSLYILASQGVPFDALARRYSQDRKTAPNGGYVGFIRINRYEQAFEDTAFGLTEDGELSKPFKTSVGWHIVKRISRKQTEAYDLAKARLEGKIKRDPRFEEAKDAMVDRIKKEAGFKAFPEALDQFAESLPDTFLRFNWKAPKPASTEPLFKLGKRTWTIGDYAAFLADNTRLRIRNAQRYAADEVGRMLYDDFVRQTVMAFEESRLEEKYPDFKSLMREYEEGILLFEATRILVWDKAAQDSSGLEEFYQTIAGKYRWAERARLHEYKLTGALVNQLEEVRTYAATHTPEATLNQFNTKDEKLIAFSEVTVEKGKAQVPAGMQWEEGALTDTRDERGARVFAVVAEIMPPANKTLQEARGYIIADYQDKLEEAWVNSLREAYNVKVNREVFEEMIVQ